MNVVLLQGTLSRPPAPRDLPSGDRLVALEVTTHPPEGRAESVPVTWVDAPDRVLRLAAGTEVVVTGRVRRRFFRAGGATASRTEVVADAVWPAAHARRASAAVGRALEGVAADAGTT